jgi:hypothetical protein
MNSQLLIVAAKKLSSGELKIEGGNHCTEQFDAPPRRSSS